MRHVLITFKLLLKITIPNEYYCIMLQLIQLFGFRVKVTKYTSQMRFIRQISLTQTFGTIKFQKIYAFFRCLHVESYYNKTHASDLIFSYNRNIQNHIKSGCLAYAHQLFDEMSFRDVISWNLLISGYKRFGTPEQAIELYSEMVAQGVRENPSTFSTVMSICSKFGFQFEGFQVHCRVILLGLCGNLYIGSSIVDFYMQLGFVDYGFKVLDRMPERNVGAWNLVLRGLCDLGLWDEVIRQYHRVKFDGVLLNYLMVCYLLQGCCNGRFVSQGEQLHCHALKAGLVESNRFVANALVDFYSTCGTLIDAKKSFEVLPYDAVISWNSMVSAYASSGMLFDALECFGRMQCWSMKPSVRSLVALLNSCSKSENLFVGRQLHCFVLKLGFDSGSIHVMSAVIDMYGKCYEVESSYNAYEDCPYKTTRACCNALLTSLLHCSCTEEVVELFKFMVDEGIEFDEFSLSATLKALPGSSFISLSSCTLLHSLALRYGFESNIVISCSLIDIYSKLGQFDHSRCIFEGLLSPNVVSFTSIINGYALNGLGRECLKLLDLMLNKGLKPDRVTFLCVLTGCNHSGLVEEGRRVFESMISPHGIQPDQRHYSCMVDLLGRAGLVYEAEALLLSFGTDESYMWSSLLRSCRTHKNEIVGQRVAKRLMELEPGNPGVYLQVSNFNIEAGKSELSLDCRENGMTRPLVGEVGHSFIV